MTNIKVALERERLDEMYRFERKLITGEAVFAAGIDEAGRGPLAGPVCAAAVILEPGTFIPYLNDSKKVSEKRRPAVAEDILEKAVAVGIGLADAEMIDREGIIPATRHAMKTAVRNLSVTPSLLLIDGLPMKGLAEEIGIKSEFIVKGDALSASIAAASIIAKVTRDRIMEEYAAKFPAYGFERHKGYGTAAHIAAIKEFGILDIHRRTFLKDDWIKI